MLILPSQIPEFDSNWPISTSTRGGLSSTGQNFEPIDKKVSTNYFSQLNNIETAEVSATSENNNFIQFNIKKIEYQPCPLLDAFDKLCPEIVKINNLTVHIMDTLEMPSTDPKCGRTFAE